MSSGILGGMVGLGLGRWLLLLVLLCGALRAQPVPDAPQAGSQPTPQQKEIPVPSDGNGLMTLHAYSNLIQMPVLVLRPDLGSLPSIPPDQFSLSIDDGPRYRPTHVRAEGTDPLSLAIVLDMVGTASDLMGKISETIEQVSSYGLTPRDHVTLFMMHCALTEEIRDKPMTPGLLETRIKREVAAWTEHNKTRHPAPCEETLHLWDALGIATVQLGELPGRRVIIAVTDGIDRGSTNTAASVAEAMQRRAVTAFGLRPEMNTDKGIIYRLRGGPLVAALPSANQVLTTDQFEEMSELSGGIALPAGQWNAGKQFARILQMVRERYVLEFPRPFNTTAGNHKIEVKVAKGGADFIRSSGTSVPLADAKIAADPTTLPNDPTLTPQMGKKLKVPPPR